MALHMYMYIISIFLTFSCMQTGRAKFLKVRLKIMTVIGTHIAYDHRWLCCLVFHFYCTVGISTRCASGSTEGLREYEREGC